MRYLFLAASLCLGLPLPAQLDHFTTNPEDLNFSEGNSFSENVLGSEPLLRYQQIDSTSVTNMNNRDRIAFRRDGRLFVNPEYTSRTIELEVVMAESDLTTISTNFAANYKTNMAVVVSRKTVVFADWAVPPAVPPASEDNIIPFDAPWSYQGKTATGNDFLWEVRVHANDQAGKDYPFDFEYVVPNATFGAPLPTSNSGISLSVGCTVPGAPAPHTLAPTLLNYGTQMQLQYASFNGAPNEISVMLLDAVDRNANLPFVCSTVNALAINLPLGIADQSGVFALNPPLPIAHDPALIGKKLILQDIRTCPGCYSGGVLHASFSNGVELTVPADPLPPAVGRIWALDPSATDATVGPLPGGIVIYTNHL